MKIPASIVIFCLHLTPAVSGQTAAELARAGHYAEAARAYLTEEKRMENQPVERIKTRLNAASCMKLAGDISAATRLLANSAPLLEQAPGAAIQAIFLSEYGSVLAMGRKPALARPILERAAGLAKAMNDTSLEAEIQNDLGIAWASAGKPDKAYESCNSAMNLAIKAGVPDLVARARQNRLLAAQAIWKREYDDVAFDLETQPFVASDANLRKSRARFESCLAESIRQTSGTDASPTLLFETVAAGIAAIRYGKEEEGFRLLESALEKSRASGQIEIERAALLALAEIYLDHSRRADAKRLLDHLRDSSPGDSPLQQAAMEILLSRCETLPGGDLNLARKHVDRAILTIEDLRGDLAISQSISDLGRTFRESAGLPYLIRADLETRDGSATALDRARRSIEAYKSWELDDFYRDDCVNLALEQATDLSESIPPGVAVLYVIPLADRTEILVGTTTGTRRFQSPVPEKILTTKVRLLRYQLEYERGLPSYVETSGFVHEALITPILGHLREMSVRHLVFIPEGALATLPVSVLRSSSTQRHLIEDFSISIAPALSLLPGPRDGQVESKVLLAGVSEGVQGFAALPGVRPELARIATIHGSEDYLLNQSFTADSLAAALIESQATTIHLASHAEFSSDPDETFLLTHGGRISMDDLERMIRPRKFSGRPVELLCLSACRTAVGDERAALGLAGIAIKSGARSVVASLWYVDDAASSTLMVGFHRNLAKGKASKAESLREAQLAMIREDPFIHPYLWASFILIGDWK